VPQTPAAQPPAATSEPRRQAAKPKPERRVAEHRVAKPKPRVQVTSTVGAPPGVPGRSVRVADPLDEPAIRAAALALLIAAAASLALVMPLRRGLLR
jgi:hypothetical protein